ncbi:MAG: fasciclin domain-containing protein, partial [Halobacteriota archaeon]
MVSKKVFSAVLVTVMILSVIGGSTAAFAQQTTMVTRTTTTTTATITQTAQGAPDLSTLVKLLLLATNFSGNKSAAQVLNETGNYTVLAPTNEAFALLNNTTLADIQSNHTRLNDVLGYHVIAQPVDLTVNKTYKTVDGKDVNIVVNGTTVTAGSGNNTATLSKTSINTSNGRVYTIDKVLTPPAGAVSISTAAASPAAGAFGLPGFEAVYAVAGLLAVAYLVLRRRK